MAQNPESMAATTRSWLLVREQYSQVFCWMLGEIDYQYTRLTHPHKYNLCLQVFD